MRVAVNENLGPSHKERLVPGQKGTIITIHDHPSACEVEFDEPFMKEFAGSWNVCNIHYERLTPLDFPLDPPVT